MNARGYRTLALALALAALAALGAGRAEAGDDAGVEQAKTYFEAGRQAYEANRYAIAASAFEEAYRLSPRPQILFSMAQAYRQQYFMDRDPAKLRRSIELFRKYMQDVPQGGRRDHAQQHLVELEPMLKRAEEEQRKLGKAIEPARVEVETQLMITSRTPGAQVAVDGDEPSDAPLVRNVTPGKHKIRVEAPGFVAEESESVALQGRLVVADVNLKEKPAAITVAAPDGAEVSLDGRTVGEAPLPTALEVNSGKHLVVVMERGRYPFARDLELARGESLHVQAELETTTQRTVSYWLLGAAGGLVVAGGAAGAVALVAEGQAKSITSDLSARRGLTTQSLNDYKADVDRRNTFAPASAILLGSGVAVGIVGALLYFIDAPRLEARVEAPAVP